MSSLCLGPTVLQDLWLFGDCLLDFFGVPRALELWHTYMCKYMICFNLLDCLLLSLSLLPIFGVYIVASFYHFFYSILFSGWRYWLDYSYCHFRKVMDERNRTGSDSYYFRIYLLVLGVYAGVRVVFAIMLKLPCCHALSAMSDQSFFQFFKWIYQVVYHILYFEEKISSIAWV